MGIFAMYIVYIDKDMYYIYNFIPKNKNQHEGSKILDKKC